jgi:SAM-dependent methyltransferase
MRNSNIDNNNNFDWGRTSKDYSLYRPGYPDSFFDLLDRLGVGAPDQRILDLGTGTGVLARAFAKRGGVVTGVDNSIEQIDAARELARRDNLNIDFILSRAEDISFGPGSFDIVSAGQSWIYFDHVVLLPKLKVMAQKGRLVLTHLNWLPREDKIAEATERLVLRYNPDWKGGGFKTADPFMFGSLQDFELTTFHKYNAALQFTIESWMGRIRACRGVGASLPSEVVNEFDKEHRRLLSEMTDGTFSIVHEISIHIFKI